MIETPRILIINSQNCVKDNATGITLRSIFTKVSPEKVLELYRYNSVQCVSDKMGFQSLQIPPFSMPINYLLRMIMGLDNYKDRVDQGSISIGNDVHLSAKEILKIKIKARVENSFLLMPKRFLKKVDNFNPEVIYTMGADFFTHRVVLYFAKRYDIPVVMHYMDNWRETAFSQDDRLLGLNRKLERQVENIEELMSRGMTISQYMADAYEEKYGHKYSALMHTVRGLNVDSQEHEGLNFVYAGGLHLNRNRMLLELADALNDFPNVNLYIYTSKENRAKYEKDFSRTNTIFMDAVPHSRISEIYKQADVLVHVESFDEKVINFTKYSMSTKIPEYMACKKPILCYAPSEIASYACISDSKAGVCIQNADELYAAISALKDEQNRRTMGLAGWEYANEHFTDKALARVISQVFTEAVSMV